MSAIAAIPMFEMRGLSLFSGIGGLDLAMEASGITIIGQVEKDPHCRQVLAHHWPNVKRMEDIFDVSGTEFGYVDIIAGGFPCQSNSLAGKRKGRKDDRNLWPEFARIIGVCRPRWIVGENVYGLLSANVDPDRGDSGIFGDILRDLATFGYRVFWTVLAASDVGAPHRRERVCIVAHADAEGWRQDIDRAELWQESDAVGSSASGLADTNNNGCVWNQKNKTARRQSVRRTEHASSSVGVGQADADSTRSQERDGGNATQGTFPESDRYARNSGQTQRRLGRVTHGLSSRLDRHPGWPARPGEAQKSFEPTRTIQGTQKDRTNRLKALGNAVVPQVFIPVFQAIVACDREVAA